MDDFTILDVCGISAYNVLESTKGGVYLDKNEVVGSATLAQNPKEIILFFDDGTVGEIPLLELRELLKGERKNVKIRDHILKDWELKNL